MEVCLLKITIDHIWQTYLREDEEFSLSPALLVLQFSLGLVNFCPTCKLSSSSWTAWSFSQLISFCNYIIMFCAELNLN